MTCVWDVGCVCGGVHTTYFPLVVSIGDGDIGPLLMDMDIRRPNRIRTRRTSLTSRTPFHHHIILW